MASARHHISLGEAFDEALPATAPKPPNLLKACRKDFYSALRDLEYQWAGPFVALDKLERKLGTAVGKLNIVEPSELILHPALLDAAFEGVPLAYSFPGDGQLWTIHVPGRIEHIAVNASLCARATSKGKPLSFASSYHPDTVRMIGNVDIFSGDSDLLFRSKAWSAFRSPELQLRTIKRHLRLWYGMWHTRTLHLRLQLTTLFRGSNAD